MAFLFLQRESGLPRRLVPFAATIVCVVLSLVPLQIPGIAAVAPSLALIAVCHWSYFRPELMPPAAVFAAGLLLDLLNGTPYVGTSALTFLLARSLVLTQRRHFINRDFAVLWLGFLALAAAAFTFTWAFVGLLHFGLLSARPFVFQAVFTVACFPVGSAVLAWLHRTFLRV